MKSLIVHYQEIALKGKNRPWFVTRLVHNLRAATRGIGVREVRALMGRIEIVLGRHGRMGPRAANGLPVSSAVANFARAGRRRWTSRQSPRRSSATSVRGSGRRSACPARRADKRFPLTSPRDRARGRRPHQDGPRLARRPRQAGADHPRRDADDRGLLLLREASRAPAGCRRASAGASRACSRVASTHRLRPGG